MDHNTVDDTTTKIEDYSDSEHLKSSHESDEDQYLVS